MDGGMIEFSTTMPCEQREYRYFIVVNEGLAQDA